MINGHERHERCSQILPLGAGRVLGFAEYGVQRGEPIFYFHGWPGSRLEAHLLEDVALEFGVRIIAVDRPGYGLSSFVRGRRLVSWPRDVHLLANALKIDRFSVIGVSGGGPYALSCAAHLPHRVNRTAVVCGVGPLLDSASAAGMQLARQFACAILRQSPAMSRPLSYAVLRGLRTKPGPLIETMAKLLPDADKAVLTESAIRDVLVSSFTDALMQGVQGPAQDLRIYFAPWGFDVSTIDVEVGFWHGEQDVVIPSHMSRTLAGLVPNSRSTYFEDEGHYSLPITRRREIVQSLLA